MITSPAFQMQIGHLNVIVILSPALPTSSALELSHGARRSSPSLPSRALSPSTSLSPMLLKTFSGSTSYSENSLSFIPFPCQILSTATTKAQSAFQRTLPSMAVPNISTSTSISSVKLSSPEMSNWSISLPKT